MARVTVAVVLDIVPGPGETVEDMAEEVVEMMSADATVFGTLVGSSWSHGDGND